MDNQEKQISREEVEKRLLLAMEDIWSDYMAYNPEGRYLDISLIRDEKVEDGKLFFSVNNRYWGEDGVRPVNVRIFKEAE